MFKFICVLFVAFWVVLPLLWGYKHAWPTWKLITVPLCSGIGAMLVVGCVVSLLLIEILRGMR